MACKIEQKVVLRLIFVYKLGIYQVSNTFIFTDSQCMISSSYCSFCVVSKAVFIPLHIKRLASNDEWLVKLTENLGSACNDLCDSTTCIHISWICRIMSEP